MHAVFATTSTTLAHGGQRYRIQIGEPWSANDPLVKDYPDLFSDHPIGVRVTTDPTGAVPFEPEAGEPPVETARRGPGEKRGARRPRG